MTLPYLTIKLSLQSNFPCIGGIFFIPGADIHHERKCVMCNNIWPWPIISLRSSAHDVAQKLDNEIITSASLVTVGGIFQNSGVQICLLQYTSIYSQEEYLIERVKTLTKSTGETLHYHLSEVITEEMSGKNTTRSLQNWDQDFNRTHEVTLGIGLTYYSCYYSHSVTEKM